MTPQPNTSPHGKILPIPGQRMTGAMAILENFRMFQVFTSKFSPNLHAICDRSIIHRSFFNFTDHGSDVIDAHTAEWSFDGHHNDTDEHLEDATNETTDVGEKNGQTIPGSEENAN